MSGFIVDNSVWQRISTHRPVYEAFDSLLNTIRPRDLLMCPIQVAEIGFSARNAATVTELRWDLSDFRDCPSHPSTDDVLRLQQLLWSHGLVRAVGAADVVIAAYALANDATVLHDDSDFEHVATVEPLFKHQWVLPRGSL